MSSMESVPLNTNETTETTANLENEQKIESIKQEVAVLYQELQEIDARKGEHQEEKNTFLEKEGYAAKAESEARNAELYTTQINKELFSNKERSLTYLNKLLEISGTEPESYRRNVQDLIDNFDERKGMYERGDDAIGGGAWILLDKYAAQLPNSEIASLVENSAIVQGRRDSLQKKMDADPDLSEINERHRNYNELNTTAEREIEIKNKLTALKNEAKELGYTDPL
jgi:hypothetical protein